MSLSKGPTVEVQKINNYVFILLKYQATFHNDSTVI